MIIALRNENVHAPLARLRRRGIACLLGLLVVGSAGLPAQAFEAVPELGEVGTEVELAVRAADGGVMPGVEVRGYLPSGEPVELGVTGADGSVRFRPAVSGRYELEARFPDSDSRLIAPYRVMPARRSGVYVWIYIAAGAGLLFGSLRRWRRHAA